MQSTIISTVEQFKALKAEFCNGPRTIEAANVPMVRFDELTPEQKRILSDYCVTDTFRGFIDLNVPGMIEAVLELVEADGTLPIFATVNGKAYSSLANSENRRKTDSRIGPTTKDGTYSNLQVRGHWITNLNDPGLIDYNGKIRSFQHRLDATLKSRDEIHANGGSLPLFPIVLGLPSQFGDMTDKAKSRTVKDDDYCDSSLFTFDEIQDVQTEIHGEPMEIGDLEKVRTDCIALRLKFLGTLTQRLRGCDVSKTGDKLTSENRKDLIRRLGGNDEVSKLVMQVYEYQRSQSGKLDRLYTDLFNPAIVATALVLACNSEKVFEDRLASYLSETVTPEHTPEDVAEIRIAKRRELLNGPISIDWKFIEKFLKEFSSSTGENGPFAPYFTELFEKRRNEKRNASNKKLIYEPLSIASMSALVQIIDNWTNGKTSAVWTTYRNLGTAEKPEYSNEYRCFGGLDVGYTAKSKKSE